MMAFDTQRLWKMLGACLASAALLTACGGGGGGGGDDDPVDPVTPPAATKFTLASGYKARIQSGASDDFDLNKPPGNCNGTATIDTEAAVPATFEGVTGFSVEQVSTLKLTDCQPANSSATGATYYNANFVPIGQSIEGGAGEYAVFKGQPPTAVLKDTVDADDIGAERLLVTMTRYEDDTKQRVIGSRTVSYVIEAETLTTVIANIITRSYEDANATRLASIQQSRYRLGPNNAFTLVSIDVDVKSPVAFRLWYEPS
jgi:hypothetical protein